MPVYMVHGFRWARDGLTGVRAFCIFNNLDDVACEYLQTEQSANTILHSFREHFPSQMKRLEDKNQTLYFLEQYDPADEASDVSVSQHYCFVADRVITMAADEHPAYPSIADERPASSARRSGTAPIKLSTPHHSGALSMNIEDMMSGSPAATPDAWEALAELRDQLSEGEKIGWWIVYNGDPERSWDEEEYEEDTDGARTPTQAEPFGSNVLGQPLPTLFPKDFKELTIEDKSIGVAVHHPPPVAPDTRPKSSRSFTNPLKKRSSKANLQPKTEAVPDLPKLKEISKKEGFRNRFFGRSTDKK